ncbi:MAG: DUF1638 domain-containing protein [Paracoccus sp. (in: a-proteobacteria)]
MKADLPTLTPAENATLPRTLLLACGALAREIIAIRDANGWAHMDLHCLPADLHLRPERIPDAVEAALAKHGADYDRAIVVYADCGTGGLLQARCEALGVEMIPGPHCYAFFDGLDDHTARAEDEFTAFYLTDFLVRQFDAFVWRAMGLDRHPELRDMYFAHYDRLIYLAQTDDPALDARAEEAAQRLGLTYVRRKTGYGDLPGQLARLGAARDTRGLKR